MLLSNLSFPFFFCPQRMQKLTTKKGESTPKSPKQFGHKLIVLQVIFFDNGHHILDYYYFLNIHLISFKFKLLNLFQIYNKHWKNWTYGIYFQQSNTYWSHLNMKKYIYIQTKVVGGNFISGYCIIFSIFFCLITFHESKTWNLMVGKKNMSAYIQYTLILCNSLHFTIEIKWTLGFKMLSHTFQSLLPRNRIVKYYHQIFELIAYYDIGYTSPSFGQKWFIQCVF